MFTYEMDPGESDMADNGGITCRQLVQEYWALSSARRGKNNQETLTVLTAIKRLKRICRLSSINLLPRLLQLAAAQLDEVIIGGKRRKTKTKASHGNNLVDIQTMRPMSKEGHGETRAAPSDMSQAVFVDSLSDLQEVINKAQV